MSLIFNYAMIYFLFDFFFMKSAAFVAGAPKNNTESTNIYAEATVDSNTTLFEKKSSLFNQISNTLYSYTDKEISSYSSLYDTSASFVDFTKKSTVFTTVAGISSVFATVSSASYQTVSSGNSMSVYSTYSTLSVNNSVKSSFFEVNSSFHNLSIFMLTSNLPSVVQSQIASQLLPSSSISSDNVFSKLLSITNYYESLSSQFTSMKTLTSNQVLSSSYSAASMLIAKNTSSITILPSSGAASEKSILSSERTTYTSNLVSSPIFSTVLQNISQTHPAIVSSYTFETSKAIVNITTSIISVTSATVIQPSLNSCELSTEKFSNAVANMTQCIILNINAMKVCFQCAKIYDMLQLYYKNLINECSWLANSNKKFRVITEILQAQDKTWKSLGCEKCYVHNTARTLSPDFEKFLALNNEVEKCFQNVSVESPIPDSALNKSATFNNTSKNICNKCSNVSLQVLKMYKYSEDNQEDSETLWCADINAAVAKIRQLWNHNYSCIDGVVKELDSVIAITCFFCFLPVIFYVGAKLHFDVNERKNANRYNHESE